MSSKKTIDRPDTQFWDRRRGILKTRKGGFIISQGAVYSHGYDLLQDLLGTHSFFQVLILNITGRLPERRLADWVEAIHITLSYPDARIWCNQIGSLAGTLRASPVAAVSAGILASDSRMYGPGATLAGVEFIEDAMKKRRNGMSIETIVEKYFQRRPDASRVIPGFVRPVARGDERIPAMERVTAGLGFEVGEHLDLAYEVEKYMIHKYNEGMNNLGYRSAFLCDQGYSAGEQFRIFSAMVNSGVSACYAEAADNPAEGFFPLRCDDVDYTGPPPRRLPEDK
jgi:citrate synthase